MSTASKAIKKPKKPSHAHMAIKKNFKMRNAVANSSLGTAKEQSAVNATTITTIGLTRFASTAACPIISPPTIPMVFPIAPGRRTPASRNSSKDNSIKSTSTTPGNGTPCLAAARITAISSAVSVYENYRPQDTVPVMSWQKRSQKT